MEVVIAAVSQVRDRVGTLDETDRVRRSIADRGLRCRELRLATLRMGWGTALPDGVRRGAAAPIVAMAEAAAGFAARELDCMIVSGADALRSELAADKQERDRLMVAYPSGETFLTAYTELTDEVLARTKIDPACFLDLRAALFENYWRTWQREHPHAVRPPPARFEPVSRWFRGVDCANPVIDFAGCIIVMTERAADACEIPLSDRVAVLGAAWETLCTDDVANIPQVATYDHLGRVIHRASADAGIDVMAEYLAGRCLLEVYTCFPVVPLAFLLCAGLADEPRSIERLLAAHEITVTGGLNLAKAPWNNTTLGACVALVERLRRGDVPYGALHSNSAFGYQQAFAVLAAPATRPPQRSSPRRAWRAP